ncbi:MAG: MGMT family protein [Candidatus Eisenbacteria bacterium]
MKRPRDIEWPLPPATGASASGVKGLGLYDRIYDVVALIPRGRVATYGQIAAIAGGCTPRMAGYAMAAVPFFVRIPWQRVINSRGCVSPRRHGEGHDDQRRLLEAEGIVFDRRARADLKRFGWPGPTPARLARLERKWKRRPAS